MGSNLHKSVDWFKLTNEILNIKRNTILFEVSVLYKLHMLDGNLVTRAFCLSNIGRAQGTNDTPSPKGKKDALDTRLVSWQNIS